MLNCIIQEIFMNLEAFQQAGITVSGHKIINIIANTLQLHNIIMDNKKLQFIFKVQGRKSRN